MTRPTRRAAAGDEDGAVRNVHSSAKATSRSQMHAERSWTLFQVPPIARLFLNNVTACCVLRQATPRVRVPQCAGRHSG